MEKQKVQVMVRGIQHDISEEAIENVYNGNYSFRNNTHYISYEEFYDMEQPTITGTTLLKIKEASIHMLKKGAVTTRMEFDTTKPFLTSYHTPYGTFQMEIITDDLKLLREKEDFQISIKYHMNMDGSFYSRCSTEIQIMF